MYAWLLFRLDYHIKHHYSNAITRNLVVGLHITCSCCYARLHSIHTVYLYGLTLNHLIILHDNINLPILLPHYYYTAAWRAGQHRLCYILRLHNIFNIILSSSAVVAQQTSSRRCVSSLEVLRKVSDDFYIIACETYVMYSLQHTQLNQYM